MLRPRGGMDNAIMQWLASASRRSLGRYGASVKNSNWSVSAAAPDSSLVVSVWQQHFFQNPSGGSLTCHDNFARWSGPGNSEFRERVTAPLASRQTRRLVTVATPYQAAVQAGFDASTLKKSFQVREDLVGEVVSVNGMSTPSASANFEPPFESRSCLHVKVDLAR